NTRYTHDTLDFLVRRCPGVRFVWVMGADNLRSFYRWQNWRGIANLMPMAVVDRMGSSLYATGGRAALALAKFRLPEHKARAPDPVSKRPDAKETLRIVLARLDDMKAEDTLTIDLTGKTSFADAMVVTSGRSTRHVAAVADSVIEGLERSGLRGIRVEGKRN